MSIEFRGTTICAVKRNGVTAIAGDGQVTFGESVVFKSNAIKVRRIYGGNVVVGFAGSVSDAFSLTERFEEMLSKFSGNLMRSAVSLAEQWRDDTIIRKLEAMLICADKDNFSRTPQTLIKFPNIKGPTKLKLIGANIPDTSVTMIGNNINIYFGISLSKYSIFIVQLRAGQNVGQTAQKKLIFEISKIQNGHISVY
jgi:hypothetical protein